MRRSLGGESFFVNDFTSQAGGLVAVASPLPGDMRQIPRTGGTLLAQAGSWVASDLTVDVDSAWGGSKSFFSGEGLLLLRCSGHGDLLIASYGAIRDYTLNEGETMTLDTGHVVAFDDTIHYAFRKSGGWSRHCWWRRAGDGLHRTRALWLQTRNSSELASWLAVRMPSQRDSSS